MEVHVAKRGRKPVYDWQQVRTDIREFLLLDNGVHPTLVEIADGLGLSEDVVRKALGQMKGEEFAKSEGWTVTYQVKGLRYEWRLTESRTECQQASTILLRSLRGALATHLDQHQALMVINAEDTAETRVLKASAVDVEYLMRKLDLQLEQLA
jgi:hypothetical protein